MAYKAIITKYHAQVGARFSRYSASDGDGNRVSVETDLALSSEENHRAAAYKLRDKMKWRGELTGGTTKTGYAWVFRPDLTETAGTQLIALLWPFMRKCGRNQAEAIQRYEAGHMTIGELQEYRLSAGWERVKTSYGTKTRAGLVECIQRIVKGGGAHE